MGKKNLPKINFRKIRIIMLCILYLSINKNFFFKKLSKITFVLKKRRNTFYKKLARFVQKYLL